METASRFELWGNILREVRPRNVLEIGVWKGEYAKIILESCNSIERYFMLDPWAQLKDWNKPYNVERSEFQIVYEEAMANTEFASRKRIVLRGTTKDLINHIPDKSLDFVYIDGDHTLRGITLDLIMTFSKIRSGGYVGGDDFLNTPWQHDIRYEPTLVCPFAVYFSEAMDIPIAVLPHNQFIIQKSVNLPFSFTDVTGNYSDISLNKLPEKNGDSTLKVKLKRLVASLNAHQFNSTYG